MTSSTHDPIIIKKTPVKGNFVQALKDHIKLLGYPPLTDVGITAEKYSNTGPTRYAYTIAVQHNDFQGYNRDENAWVKSVSEFYDTNKRVPVDGVLMFKIALNRGAMVNEHKFKKNTLHRKKPLTEEEIAKTWKRGGQSPKVESPVQKSTRKPGVVKVKEIGKLPEHVTAQQKRYGVLLVAAAGREAVVAYVPGYSGSGGRPTDYATTRLNRVIKNFKTDITRFYTLDQAISDALLWVDYRE
jgi:hypothetical protein